MPYAIVEDKTVKVFEDSGQVRKVFKPAHGAPLSASVQGDNVVVQLDNGMTSVHDLDGQVVKVS